MSYFIGFGWGFTVAILFAAIVERKWGCPYCHDKVSK